MMNLGLHDKTFYNKLFKISIPIILQNLISSVLNMVDTVMVGSLGAPQIAAVGLANQIFFVFFLLIYGINSGCGIFIAQYWGSRDRENIRRTMAFSILVGTAVGLIFTFLALYMPRQILILFRIEPDVLAYGVEYMRYSALSYLLASISVSYSFAARSIGEAKTPMLISAVSLTIHAILNFILIFGYLGLPRMEIKGAAIGTVISRVIEVSALLYWVYVINKDGVLSATLKDAAKLSLKYIKNIMITAMPVILNDVSWSLGMTMYSAAYARLGTTAMASIQIANTVQNIFIVISIGLASSCAVMLGNSIGENNKEGAISYANRFIRLGTLAGAVLGVMLVLISPVILMLFGSSHEAQQLAQVILVIMGLFLWSRYLNNILVVGILRSGGDTTFAMVMETCSVWLIGVPLAFMGALWWHLPVFLVYTLISLEELVKSYLGLIRVRSRKWVRDVRT
jgi:putative MATE family efflux protein